MRASLPSARPSCWSPASSTCPSARWPDCRAAARVADTVRPLIGGRGKTDGPAVELDGAGVAAGRVHAVEDLDQRRLVSATVPCRRACRQWRLPHWRRLVVAVQLSAPRAVLQIPLGPSLADLPTRSPRCARHAAGWLASVRQRASPTARGITVTAKTNQNSLTALSPGIASLVGALP